MIDRPARQVRTIIFRETIAESGWLHEQINEWCKKQPAGVRILDVKFATDESSDTALVIYMDSRE